MKPEQHRRAFNVTPRILSETDGTAEFVASDNTLDSYNEVVMCSGWRFDFFQKNAPFVDSHNYYSITDLLGRVLDGRVENNQLIERVQFAKDVEENTLARLAWKMTLGGFLRAVSVGFRALKWVCPGDQGWNGAVADAGLSVQDSTRCRRIFTEHQQLELSACIIGANPNALAKAYKENAIGDADLAAVGFADDDMHFLQLAGAATEKPDLDPVMRALVDREMRRILGRKRALQEPPSTTAAGKPDGAEVARRQAAERADFLRKLEGLMIA